MIIISDTSPIVTLWQLGHLELFHMLYGEVVIPPEVELEIRGEQHPDSAIAIFEAVAGWLRVLKPQSIEPILGLDPGETAAIALAKELNADFLVIDEKTGRKLAAQQGVRIIGTVGVLELAADAGLIDLPSIFEELLKTDFHVTTAFLDSRLKAFIQRQSGS